MNSDRSTNTPPSGGPTKDEILAISLQKLGPTVDDICVDLGCGTGRVSIALAGRVRMVHAVDRRREAYEWTQQEAIRMGISNLIPHYTDAVRFLSGIEHLDIAFIGGSKDLAEVIALLHQHSVRRVVINAVMLETVNIAMKTLQKYDMFDEIVHVQVSHSYPIAEGIMFKPIDPVFIITGGCLVC